MQQVSEVACTGSALQVEHLVLETLHTIRKNGFAESSIDAAVNTTEFALRENNTGRFPKGLALMFRAMKAWVYDRDPYECALSCLHIRLPSHVCKSVCLTPVLA